MQAWRTIEARSARLDQLGSVGDVRDLEISLPLLPLFPLDLVLLPGTPLPLHIFEPRYKEMVAECRAGGTPFGVVRAREVGLAGVGCTAEIVSVTKEYADGRLDLIAEGRTRFEVLELNQERSFLRAAVLTVPDEPGAASSEEIERAIQVYRAILALAGAVPDVSSPDQSRTEQSATEQSATEQSALRHGALSYHIAGSLPLALDFKQKLLEMRSERERIQSIAEYLESILPNLRHAARTREKAGGNGHAH
jgi:Lon protease-like protein